MSGTGKNWPTADALAAMGKVGLGEGDTFTSTDLKVWLPQYSERQRQNTTSELGRKGLLLTGRKGLEGYYTVTAAGQQAIEAAAQGAVLKSGPKGSFRHTTRPSGTLLVRLWALLRARGMVDSDSAASTLADAGDDVVRLRKSISRYLHDWARAGVVQVSARRIGAAGKSNGFKRYVLTKDSPEPPRVAHHNKGQCA